MHMAAVVFWKKFTCIGCRLTILFTSPLFRFLRFSYTLYIKFIHTYTLCVQRFLSPEFTIQCHAGHCCCFFNIAKLRQSKEEAVAAAPEDQQDHFAAEPVGWAPPYRNIPPTAKLQTMQPQWKIKRVSRPWDLNSSPKPKTETKNKTTTAIAGHLDATAIQVLFM